jgi:hypothetical protein
MESKSSILNLILSFIMSKPLENLANQSLLASLCKLVRYIPQTLLDSEKRAARLNIASIPEPQILQSVPVFGLVAGITIAGGGSVDGVLIGGQRLIPAGVNAQGVPIWSTDGLTAINSGNRFILKVGDSFSNPAVWNLQLVKDGVVQNGFISLGVYSTPVGVTTWLATGPNAGGSMTSVSNSAAVVGTVADPGIYIYKDFFSTSVYAKKGIDDKGWYEIVMPQI